MQVGDAGGSTKEVPFKAKVQLTLKVPQDNMQNSAVVFHVKKRWDFQFLWAQLVLRHAHISKRVQIESQQEMDIFFICSAKLLHANAREKSCDVKRERERDPI